MSDRKAYNWSRVLETMELLEKMGYKEEKVSSRLKTYPDLAGETSGDKAYVMFGPKAVCNILKIGRDELHWIIKEEPLKFFSLASKTTNKRIKLDSLDLRNAEKTAFLLRLGYVENSDEMVNALKKFQGRGDELQERFDCLVKAGLDYNVVTKVVKRALHIRSRPKDIIEKKTNILTNYLNYLVESPTYLCYSMERIHQRFSMYIWLWEREVVMPRLTLGTIIGISITRFLSYFVNSHPEGPATWESKKVST